jgi:hypothetical protein
MFNATFNWIVYLNVIVVVPIILRGNKGSRGRDSMVVGFTTTYAISAYHH